jgi:hypothetical protein
MGHDTHFLTRLERVDGNALNLALGLYRDPKLLRFTLSSLPINPNAEVVALPLRPGDDPPLALVSRTGKFITCLGQGMQPREDTAIARYEHLHRLMGDHHALQEAQNEGRARMNIAIGRLFSLGPWLAREDMEMLITVYSLLPGEMQRTFSIMIKDAFKFQKEFRPRDFRSLNAVERTDLSLYWKTAWAAAHSQIIHIEAAQRIHDLYPEKVDHEVMVRHVVATLTLGHEGHMIRAAWALGCLGPMIMPFLEKWFLTFDDPKPTDPFHHTGGLLAPFGLLALAIRQPDLRPAVKDTLERLAGPQVCQETRGMTPRQVITLYNDDQEILVTLALAGVALRHLAEADQGFPSSHAELAHVARAVYNATPHPDSPHPDSFPIGPPRKRLRPDLPVLQPGHPTLTALPFGLYGTVLNNGDRIVERLNLIPALAHLSAGELFMPRACLDDLQDSLTLNTPIEDVRQLLTTMHMFIHRSKPVRRAATPGRNDLCSCGSGQKYKRCCGK